MVPDKWSINRLACELAMDRRSLARRLEGLAPIEEKKGAKRTERFYRLAAVFAHLSRTDESEALDLNQERARLTKLQAEKVALELAETRGEVVRMSLVVPHWQGIVANMRARLLALPSRAAIEIASDQREVVRASSIIQTLLYEILTDIASAKELPDELLERTEKHQPKQDNENERKSSNEGRDRVRPGRKVRRGRRMEGEVSKVSQRNGADTQPA